MPRLDSISVDEALAGRSGWIDRDLFEELSRVPLECIQTEFPHYIGSADSPDDIRLPRDQHPVFYGCYDWHSAVHSHWCLIRQLRLSENHPLESEIVATIDEHVSAENVTTEVASFNENPTFERPYGWAWFLRLVVELELWDHPQADEWRSTLRPLETKIVSLVESEFLTQEFPIRSGLHRNSAYALQGVLDYARIGKAEAIESAAEQKSLAFYLEDRDYPIQYEPISWDTISPSLTEADLMRRVLEPEEFVEWVHDFLPFESPHFPSFLEPHTFDLDSAHAGELHLAGLNLTKAWCLADISTIVGDGERADSLSRGAERHAETGLNQAVTEDYAGSHWLISFVLYLFTRNDGGIAPA